MNKQRLFQFAVLYHEKVSKGPNMPEETKTSLLVPVDTILATDERVATLQIAQRIPATHQDKLEDVEIVLRPF